MTDYIEIRNWDGYQDADTFKKSQGTPPWIKLYHKLLDDPDVETFSAAEFRAYIKCLLWAARTGNRLPYDPSWWRKRFGSRWRPLGAHLSTTGFLVGQQTDTFFAAKEEKPSRNAGERIAVDKSRSDQPPSPRATVDYTGIEELKPETSSFLDELNDELAARRRGAA